MPSARRAAFVGLNAPGSSSAAEHFAFVPTSPAASSRSIPLRAAEPTTALRSVSALGSPVSTDCSLSPTHRHRLPRLSTVESVDNDGRTYCAHCSCWLPVVSSCRTFSFSGSYTRPDSTFSCASLSAVESTLSTASRSSPAGRCPCRRHPLCRARRRSSRSLFDPRRGRARRSL